MEKQIEVVLIPDKTRIIINYGLNDNPNLQTGKHIEIFDPNIEIKDPETKKTIGKYELVKAELIITEVHEGYSVARDKQGGTQVTARRISSPMSGLNFSNEPITYEEINVNTSDVLTEKSKYGMIQIGDSVRLK